MALFIEVEDSIGRKVSVRKTSIVSVTEEAKETLSISVAGINSGVRISRPYAEFMNWLEDQMK